MGTRLLEFRENRLVINQSVVPVELERTEVVKVSLPPLVVPCIKVSILESMTLRILD